MKKYLYLFIIVFFTKVLFAQNELYIKDNVADPTKPTLYIKGSNGSMPSLFVDGEIINSNGVFQNDSGIIEIKGNFTNTVGIGVSKYESTGVENFSGTSNQTISGTFNGTTSGTLNGASSGINQLFNVQFNNTSTVTLANDVNNNEEGSTAFIGNTVVLTGSNKYYIKNSDPAKLSGYGSVGDITKFFQGELWRETESGSSYDLPVGISRTASGAFGEGIQMATINVTAASGKGALQAKFENGSPSATPIIICPGAPTVEAKDVDDILNNGFWTITNTSNNISEFSITLSPADFTSLGTPGDYTIIQNGGTTGVYDCTGAITGLPITHSGLSSFSKWEIGASTDGAPLPVELAYLEANTIDNKYIQVAWQTATEINNDGFEVQRSLDGFDFETIGFVKGNGNSTEKNSYSLNDENVKVDLVYYYRLKQIDFDGTYEFSLKVSASLNGVEKNMTVSLFIPNPGVSNSNINITVSKNSLAKIVMFNAVGQVVLHLDIPLSEGSNVLPFDLKNLPAGIYQTNIFIEDQSFSRKLNISK